MEFSRVNLSTSRVELTVVVPQADMAHFAHQAAEQLSQQTTIEGFRPGKAPYDMVKARVGEMAILEQASQIAVRKTIDQALKEQVSEDWIGQPQITVTKLAPDNDFEYKVLVTLLPEVKLGTYKGLNLPQKEVSVSDEEVEKVVDHLKESRVRESAVERAAEINDKVTLDINLFLDNVPLEGGQGKDTAVILGKDYLVPGFDKEILGIKAGDERQFSIHYPAEHFQKNLAGKKIDFKVKAKTVFARELPEMNDDFAKTFGLVSFEELKKNIKANVLEEKKHDSEQKYERLMLEKIVQASKFSDIPEMLIENEIEVMLHELEHNVSRQGAKFEDYLSSIGKTRENLKQELRPEADKRVKTSLALRAIIKTENIAIEDEQVHKELEHLKKHYGSNPKSLETLQEPSYREHLAGLLLNRKALDWLVAANRA